MSARAEIAGLCKEAKSWMRHKDFPRALQVLHKALALDETSVDVHEMLGTVHFLAQKYDQAVEHFTRITQLDPVRANAFVNLGAVYNRMQKHQEAINALRKAIQRDKRSAQAFYNLGIAHRGLDQQSMAVSAYREALRLEPEMAEAHLNLANIYLDMTNFQQAVTHYRKALELKPNFDRAKRGLAKADALITKAKQAISPFGRLVDETKVSAAAAAPTADRELTHRERFEDRREVHQFATEIERHAGVFLVHLKEALEPALLALDRAVMQAAEAPSAMARAHMDFQAARNQSVALRDKFRRAIVELRAHEELMNQPQVDAQQ